MSRALRIRVGDEEVTGLYYPASGASLSTTLVLGHGAGADQHSDFMTSYATALSSRGIDVMTFNFLYTEHKRGAPDRTPKLEAAWRAAIDTARSLVPKNALAIGGKSMGGRIASHVAAAGVDGLRALVFLGYPLHAPKKRDDLRSEHLPRIRLPMLFIQGDRDPFGTPAEVEPIADALVPKARIFAIAGGDHSFKVAKRDGGGPEVHTRIQDEIARWLQETVRS